MKINFHFLLIKMYKKLISLDLIKSNNKDQSWEWNDQFDGIDEEETMNSKYNFLIDK